ncbi:MAG: LysR family transcriptional regulator [Microbacterium sp.]|uniref:LysR family transcriptional regulator n=1 Tax=Microbacterium sp. TaxID=51671 RepID=UPI00260D55FF|nr:LysR family transcriptional regulator [Microbacterium sp.]MCX6503247.1 LysR family transcriptional regulator [Microbacterium sp.]
MTTGDSVGAGVARGELTFRQLLHFIAAAEIGTISGAANRLQFSPSAISASITELERALGAELCIRRRAQGITLTSAGRLVLTRAKRLVSDVSELGWAVHGDGRDLVGPLVVGCFVTLAPSLLPRLLEEYEQRHPRVTIDFVVGAQDELEHALRSGSIDVALMYDLGGLDDTNSFVLYKARGYALFGQKHPLAVRPGHTVALEELAPEPLVLFDQTPSSRYAMSMFLERGLTPNVRHTTHAFELTRSIVARSDSAYAILVQSPANKQSYEGLRVIEKDIDPPPRLVPVVVAWAADVELSARARALTDILHDQYEALRPGPP